MKTPRFTEDTCSNLIACDLSNDLLDTSTVDVDSVKQSVKTK